MLHVIAITQEVFQALEDLRAMLDAEEDQLYSSSLRLVSNKHDTSYSLLQHVATIALLFSHRSFSPERSRITLIVLRLGRH